MSTKKLPDLKLPNYEIPFSFDHYNDVLGFVVSQAAFQLSSTLKSAIAEAGYDITPREFALLNRLHQHGQLNQSQLANLTYKDRPAVTRMLDKLLKRNYVKKLICDDDRRALQVSLTAKGEGVRQAIVPIAADLALSACKDVPKKDLFTTLNTLKIIAARVGN